MADIARHIAVDGRELLGQPTGVGRYVGEVLQVWNADPGFPHRLSVIVPAEPPPALVTRLSPRVQWIVAPSARRGTWWEQIHLPRAIRRAGADVLWAAAYTAPLGTRCPFVVAIYDVSYYAHPEWFGAREGARRRWLTRRAASRAAAVVTISAFSAAEIERWLAVPTARLILAPPGAPALRARPDDDTDPVVLFVGSLFTRRHIPDLIHGFATAAAEVPDARLILVGDNRTRPHVDPRAIAAAAGVADRVVWREYVSDVELDELYSRARVFAFLSDYEGFAMTPLEALARGVPPVLLDTAVSREVYGEAATLVAASSPSIGAALSRLLTDPRARAVRADAGRARLLAFSWIRTAAAVRTALERAAR